MRRTKRGGWPYSQPPNVQFEINRDSPQSDGLVMWMPWGGGTPGSHHHVDRVKGLAFTEGGTPVWVADGERGWSMLFDDAQNEYLQASAPVTDYPFTFSCWFNSDDAVAHQSMISIGDASATSPYLRLSLQGADPGDLVAVVHWNGAAVASAVTTSGYSVNTWHHAAGVGESATMRAVFIDAGSKGTNVVNRTLTNIDNFRISSTADSTPIVYMSGQITDARVYNRALTDTEVYQLYAEPWELYKPLIRRWTGWKSPVVVRIPRYGFTNFQVPGIV